jgi:hypothetical protein
MGANNEILLKVWMSNDEHARFKAVSEMADVPMSSLIRRLLRAKVPAWEQALKEDRLALL